MPVLFLGMSGGESLSFDFKLRAIPISIFNPNRAHDGKKKAWLRNLQSDAAALRLLAFAMLFVLKFLYCDVTVKKNAI